MIYVIWDLGFDTGVLVVKDELRVSHNVFLFLSVFPLGQTNPTTAPPQSMTLALKAVKGQLYLTVSN